MNFGADIDATRCSKKCISADLLTWRQPSTPDQQTVLKSVKDEGMRVVARKACGQGCCVGP